jgi:hypothetical protein
MAYIGKTPVIGNFQVCDAITVVDAQAAYTMQVGGVNVSPESANHMLVSLNGILQAPTSSFTVSGSTITFASNLVTGDVIDFIQILGNVLDLGVPSDNTVSLAKLTATGTKDATTFLRGDNTFGVPPLGGITEADLWKKTADQQITTNAITTNLARVNKIGTGMTESSGNFSFPSTGMYMITAYASISSSGTTTNSRYILLRTRTTTNNSSYSNVARAAGHGNAYTTSEITIAFSSTYFFNVTDTSTHKVQFTIEGENQSNYYLKGTSGDVYTSFQFIRLGDSV